MGSIHPQRAHEPGIEAHERGGAAIFGRDAGGFFGELNVAVPMAFQFDDDRNAPGDASEKFLQRRNAARAILEGNTTQRGEVHVAQHAFSHRQTIKRVIVKDDDFTVSSELDVAFDAVARGRRDFGGLDGVLHQRAAEGAIVQPAMRDGTRRQPAKIAHSTSKMASTSTEASKGSSATPTVVRAWRPASPKISTMRSEAPFITFGSSAKVGTALMKPPRRTHRLILSRSPSVAFACTSTLMSAIRAAAWPRSGEVSAPSLPLMNSPPGVAETWPEQNRRLPVRTFGT